MDSQDYQILLDLNELKSITKVAQKYYLSQPALTKRLQRIEDELGCSILTRHKKGVTFTAIGEQVLPYCRDLLRTQQEMVNSINNRQGLVGGALSILCSNSYSYHRLPLALKNYCTAYPLVSISVTVGRSGVLYQQFLQREDCVAILRGERAWGDGRLSLASEPLCLACSYENADRPLRSHPFIFYHTDDRASLSQIERWTLEREIPFYNAKYSINHINSCKELALLGMGWSILPRTCLDGFDGFIQNLYFSDGTPLTRDTFLLYHSSYYQLEQVRLFVDTLVATDHSYSSPSKGQRQQVPSP